MDDFGVLHFRKPTNMMDNKQFDDNHGLNIGIAVIKKKPFGKETVMNIDESQDFVVSNFVIRPGKGWKCKQYDVASLYLHVE